MLAIATLSAICLQLAPMPHVARTASADTGSVPKAVFIVGPTGGLTDTNLRDAERMAVQAEAAGMEVRRVFFPNATWDNVLANIQGASLVVYMGHGYGWPSPYTKELTESRQNGMGLNKFDGSGRNEYTYYGANKIRESISLAPNAVVILNHLCYSAGNGEPGMAIPSEDVARQRVDNMANGWLAVGARSVFAYAWWQRLNYPKALMTTDATMDELFMTPGDGSPSGYIGSADVRFDSERTPGAVNHLDPHQRYGYYRAVTGDLAMSAAEFRAGAMGTLGGGTGDADAPPQITSLSASGSATSATLGTSVAAFHPNGDGLSDELVLTHSVTKAATLEVTVSDAAGAVVNSFSSWSGRGTSTSRWNGRNADGAVVPDGTYTLTYVPRDAAGQAGTPVSLDALVLTALKMGMPTAPAFFASDADGLAPTVKLPITLSQGATVSWRILDQNGAVVRVVRNQSAMPAGQASFVWDGRRDDRSWAPEGWYRSVVTAQTSLGTYSHERRVYAGAFRVTPSAASPARGTKLTLTIVSTEGLGSVPSVSVTQPGLEPVRYATTKVGTRKYKVSFTLAASDPGNVTLQVSGTDARGGSQQTTLSLPLR